MKDVLKMIKYCFQFLKDREGQGKKYINEPKYLFQYYMSFKMCYYEDVRYRGKRIIRSQHKFTMEIPYRVNPISFFRDLLAYTIGKWITSKIVFQQQSNRSDFPCYSFEEQREIWREQNHHLMYHNWSGNHPKGMLGLVK